MMPALSLVAVDAGSRRPPAGVEPIDVEEPPGGLSAGPGVAWNLAAAGAPGPRILLLAPEAPAALPAAAWRRTGTLLIGPDDVPLGPGRVGLQRLAARVLDVVGLALDREAFTRARGLDEALAAEAGLGVALAELALRLAGTGAIVQLVAAPPSGSDPSSGAAGLAAGLLLRRAAPHVGRAQAAAAAAGIGARAAGPAALERIGLPMRRPMKGHDLVGLAAGLRGMRSSPRPPDPGALPAPVAEALAAHGVVDLVLDDRASPGARRPSWTAIDRDGLPRVRMRVDHAPPSGAREALEAAELWRRAEGPHADGIAQLHAVATAGATLIAVESLHVPVAAAGIELRFVQAARWLEARRVGAPAATFGPPPLDTQGLDAEVAQRLSASAEALAGAPALPRHGDLSLESVAVAPGRTVLTGWEHFQSAAVPGFDALQLGLAASAAQAGEAATEAAVARLLGGDGGPYTEPFHEELAALGLADRAADVALLTLAELAARERQRDRCLDPAAGVRYRRLLRVTLSLLRAARPAGASALATAPRASPP